MFFWKIQFEKFSLNSARTFQLKLKALEYFREILAKETNYSGTITA